MTILELLGAVGLIGIAPLIGVAMLLLVFSFSSQKKKVSEVS
jgi:hypothetical protein